MAQLRDRFDREHERTFGHRGSQHAPEILNIRVRGRGAATVSDAGDVLDHRDSADGADLPARPAYFGPTTDLVETPVLARSALAEASRSGPIIVEEMDATTLIPPGWNVALDGFGNLVMEAAR
jgi:N-methylhydantoinase A